MRTTELIGNERFHALEPMNGCGLLGALKCVAGMQGVMPMIHGPVSCSSGHRLAMLYADVEPLLPTTCVEQTQVILGSAERLNDAMLKAYAKFQPEILLVLLTCATAMTGESYDLAVADYEKKTGKRAIVLDGSALAGDETDICPQVYAALCRELNLRNGTAKLIALDGFAKTDYAFEQNAQALRSLIEQCTDLIYTPGLFAGSDVFENDSCYRQAQKLPVSLLWQRDGMESLAPIGVRGSHRFLKHLTEACNAHLQKATGAIVEAFELRLKPLAEKLKAASLPVGIEGAGWYAYALADYLKNDLGCKVLLSVDRSADSIDGCAVCDEFYEDTGRFELVELMQDFGARLVFGSSNVQMDDAWSYVPFYQPVWRVVEPTAFFGFDAAIEIAQLLLREAER